MRRRKYLGVIILIAGSSLAGCSGDSDSQEANSENTNKASNGENREQATAHLETAGDALQKAGEELSAQSDKFENADLNSGVNFKPDTINSYLETASEELDAAEEVATADQNEKIEIARKYVSFAKKTTEFLDVFADGYTQLVTGYTYFESERYNDAANKLNTAQETFNDSDDLLTVVQERADQIDTEELDTIEQVEQETMQTDLTTMDRLLPVMETLAGGLRQISLGMVNFEQADKNLNEERYLDAENQFNEAVDHFTTAESEFKQQEESAPSSMKSSVIELTCYSGALKDGSKHLAAASSALANGNNSRAQTESDEAKKDFDRCSYNN